MKITLNWLKQYVDFNWSPEELTRRLTLPGRSTMKMGAGHGRQTSGHNFQMAVHLKGIDVSRNHVRMV
jgi:hypothetical protein